MPIDMTWFVGQRVTAVEKKGYSWFFDFDGGSRIATESPWRLITVEGIAVMARSKEIATLVLTYDEISATTCAP